MGDFAGRLINPGRREAPGYRDKRMAVVPLLFSSCPECLTQAGITLLQNVDILLCANLLQFLWPDRHTHLAYMRLL